MDKQILKKMLIHFCELMQVKTDSERVLLQIESYLKHCNIEEFEEFILDELDRENKRFNKKYQFQNGVNRFLLFKSSYEKNIAIKSLDDESFKKSENICKKLYNKIIDIFEAIDHDMQTKGRALSGYRIDHYFTEKELKIVVQIGKRDRLMSLVRINRQELQDLIKSIVTKTYLNFINKPLLPNKQKEKVAITLQDIKDKGRTLS